MSPRPSQKDRPDQPHTPAQGLSFAFPLRLPENGTGAGNDKPSSTLSKRSSPPK